MAPHASAVHSGWDWTKIPRISKYGLSFSENEETCCAVLSAKLFRLLG